MPWCSGCLSRSTTSWYSAVPCMLVGVVLKFCSDHCSEICLSSTVPCLPVRNCILLMPWCSGCLSRSTTSWYSAVPCMQVGAVLRSCSDHCSSIYLSSTVPHFPVGKCMPAGLCCSGCLSRSFTVWQHSFPYRLVRAVLKIRFLKNLMGEPL